MLGVAPQVGRLFQSVDAELGNNRAVLISDGFGKTNFGGSPDALGKTLMRNEQPYTIVGVMPPKFKFPYGKFQLWVSLPLAATDEQKRPSRLYAVAHLREDIALPAA